MKTDFTLSYMLGAGRGCYEKEKVQKLMGEKKEISLLEILDWDIRIQDKYWFLRNRCELSTDQFRHLAIGCALVVLPIYENKNPENKAPREAIEAAQNFLRDEISRENLLVFRRAAAYAAAYAAADADADAANAADAAAYAADAANATDAAAADAAYAAAYAAYAADAAYADAAAADADDYKTQLLNFLKDFVKSNK